MLFYDLRQLQQDIGQFLQSVGVCGFRFETGLFVPDDRFGCSVSLRFENIDRLSGELKMPPSRQSVGIDRFLRWLIDVALAERRKIGPTEMRESACTLREVAPRFGGGFENSLRMRLNGHILHI